MSNGGPALPPGRAGALVAALQLAPHPEGGWFREIFRSADDVACADGRGTRQALTSIDFLLAAGERSAWHRVASDEAWHLLEGGPLRLWLVSPCLQQQQVLTLAAADDDGRRPRAVVPAHWWQAAEPAGDNADGFAYVGATVGPGFSFADFDFGRDDEALCTALQQRWPAALRLL